MKHILVAFFLFINVAYADTVVGSAVLQQGENIYSPFLICLSNKSCMMWYSGWQTKQDRLDAEAHIGGDKIYYRQSLDGKDFGPQEQYVTVLTRDALGPGYEHVGDPKVTITWNSIIFLPQLTMFFTAMHNGCNEIWSVVSIDSTHWFFPEKLELPNCSSQPSPLVDFNADGTVWKVYYTDDKMPYQIRMVHVDGNRKVQGNAKTVYISNSWINKAQQHDGVFAPMVVRIGDRCNMFYNRIYDTTNSTNIDVVLSSDTSCEEFTPANSRVLINSRNSSVCSTLTPGVHQLDQFNYRLAFSVITERTERGICNYTANKFIGMFEMRMP